ncbi:MAG TPA: PEP-CTERM sorting domain-containing protein [Steroidobacteraceae bacterium]|nr:PEP-CTERM sorting domain-containing protein [Steroidobacteraceae bacterium]
MKARIVGLLAVGLLLAAPMFAHAVPILTPIGNVTINSTVYSVSLLSATDSTDQSFDDLNPSITFSDAASAQTATSALIATFGLGFNWNPTCAFCLDGVRIVYGVDADTYQYFTASASFGLQGPFDRSRTENNAFSFAQFTAMVPEPDSLLLLGFGLVGFSFSRRRNVS